MNQDFTVLQEDMIQVGLYILWAIEQTAKDYGGEELAEVVKTIALSHPGQVLPNPEAIEFLKYYHAEAPERIMNMAREYQKQDHKKQVKRLNKMGSWITNFSWKERD